MSRPINAVTQVNYQSFYNEESKTYHQIGATSKKPSSSAQTLDSISPSDLDGLEATELLNVSSIPKHSNTEILNPMSVYQAHLAQRDIKSTQALLKHESVRELCKDNTELTSTYYNLQTDNIQRKKEQKILSTVTWVSTAATIVGTVIGFFMYRGDLPRGLSTSGAQIGLTAITSSFAVGGGVAEIAQAKSTYSHGVTLGKMTAISSTRERNLSYANTYSQSLASLSNAMNENFKALKRIVDSEHQIAKQCLQY